MPVKPHAKDGPFDYGPMDERGMYENYPVLPDEARKPTRPVRTAYRHLTCGTVTYMNRQLAETYATQPSYYTHTYCAGCRTHRPVDEFVWDGTMDPLGA